MPKLTTTLGRVNKSNHLNSVAGPWHFGTDPDLWLAGPYPVIFVCDFQDSNTFLF